MATSKGRREGSSSKTTSDSTKKNDARHGNHSSQADGASSAQDTDDNAELNAQTLTRDRPQRSRDNRTGSKTSVDGTPARRGKNEPGHYQSRDDDADSTSNSGNDDPIETIASASKSRNMESVFDDEDMTDDPADAYDIDEGDGDIDWDDSMPARGGGKSPDR
jgi:hypothetical protein